MYEYNVYNPYAMNTLGLNQNNCINLGNIGYNNMPYYTGNYNYYNPYLVQQQQQQLYNQQMQQYNEMMDMFNYMDQAAMKSLGVKIPDPSEYMPSQEEQMAQYERYMALQNIEYLEKIDQKPYIDFKSINYANSFINNLEKSEKEFPKDRSAADDFKMMSKRSMEIADKELVKERISNTYNKNQFNQLLQRDAGTNYFASTFSNINVDDMTHNINIPSSEYLEKKKRFMEEITKQMY